MYSIGYCGGWVDNEGVLIINNRGWCRGVTLEETITKCKDKIKAKQSVDYKYEFEKAKFEQDVLTKESVEKLINQTNGI